jgi:alkanesulfonate monooxygenase SsuD/methylene tetrahydromethanopterin reductase-like flavin-dependent oxidoreductase (luciferase family)
MEMEDGGGAPAIRFSAFTVFDHYPTQRARGIGAYFDQVMDEIVLAEELGFHSYWVAEHHFHEYGIISNPALFLSAAAQRTSRIKLGPSVSILTFRNPLQVAEDYAILDQLSGGRLLMGVGSGYLKHEFEGFGIEPAEKRDRFDASLDILKRAWAGERIEDRHDWFRSDGGTLNVLPLQSPHPPIYIAVLRREAAYHVGKQGNRVMLIPYATTDEMSEIGDLIGEYRSGYNESGAALVDDDAPLGLHTYVAETDEQARADAAEAFDLYVATRLYAKSQTYDDILRSRLGLFGSVERVTDQIVELYGHGVRHILFLTNFGALEADKVHRSMRLLADEVLPRVNARIGVA